MNEWSKNNKKISELKNNLNRFKLNSIPALYIELRSFYDSHLRQILRKLFAAAGIVSIAVLLLEYGFYYPEEWAGSLKLTAAAAVYYLIGYEFVSLLFSHETFTEHVRSHIIETFIVLAVIIQWSFKKNILDFLLIENMSTDDTALFYLSISQIFLIFSNLTRLIRNTQYSSVMKVNPSMVFVISFLIVITAGFFLLSMPKSVRHDISAVDLLFTAVSATSVTGLSTLSISDSFTRTGQVIILILIQIGGLGLMTLTSFFSFFLTGRTSVTNQLLMKDLLSEDSLVRVKNLIAAIALITFSIEAAGAAYLYFTLPPLNYSASERFFYSVFHSISAFCNAGFSLYPSNFVDMYTERTYLSGIMILIVLGGLGFPVLNQIGKIAASPRRHHKRLSVTVRVVLYTGLILYTVSFFSYMILERNHSLENVNLTDSIFDSLFYSVTMRTAGFNIHPAQTIGIPMAFVSLLFMWIGASPGSTGGGIKTTTFAISVLHTINQIRGKESLTIFNKEIAPESISRAFTTLLLSFFVIFSGIFFLILAEDFHLMDIVFEVVSAFGTVGLSRGITPDLSGISKIALCVVMLAGRMGIFTVLAALLPKAKPLAYRYPSEYIMVG